MRQQNSKGPKLPHQLLEQIRESGTAGRSKRGRNGTASRKERRKAERVQKKVQRRQPRLNHTHATREESPESDATEDFEETPPPPQLKQSKTRPSTAEKPLKSILKRSAEDVALASKKAARSPSPPRVSRGMRHKLEEDDAEIAALEKKLGLKGKKKLPKTFEEDGLNILLGGLDDELGGDRKRKRAEDDAWLESKRRKSSAAPAADDEDEDDEEASDDGMSDFLDGEEDDESGEEEDEGDLDDLSGDEDGLGDDVEDTGLMSGSDDGDEDDGFDGFESEESESHEQPRVRENPYVAPVPANTPPATKYIPPSLRAPSTSDTESLSRLRRQAQGLLNRLSEANLITILRDIEQLYQNNPRQYVMSTLIDLLLGLVCDRTSLMDTFIILHAGFVAAVYKVIGADFGAQLVERIVIDFDRYYQDQQSLEAGSKEASNLMSFVSELYNFQVIGSNLVFDYIRLFLDTMSEVNTELLLRIIKNSGPQLRQDDPTALKDIVVLLQKSVAKVGEATLSVRTKFMIETINNLKNNRMKTGVAASSVVTEHTVRMKKTLGSLNTRNLKASEPLRIGLSDIRDTEKKGKWWLVGASWKNNMADSSNKDDSSSLNKSKSTSRKDESADSGTSDLLQLAKEQRMNTDIRRAIFITIMSATDYKDAHLRLLKLKLKRAQELEIPRVLIHCAGAEQSYNPYYTLIARRHCSDHKLKMAFQFSLWDLFKRMGERQDEDDVDFEEDGEGTDMSTRKIVNLAKMFGTLIADGGLSIMVLKTLNFAYLQPKTRTFAEVLLITVMLHTQKKSSDGRDERALLEVFMRVNDAPQMVTGLRYFLKKVVGKSDLAGGKFERDTVRWGCKVAADALVALSSAGLEEA